MRFLSRLLRHRTAATGLPVRVVLEVDAIRPAPEDADCSAVDTTMFARAGVLLKRGWVS